MEEEQNVIDSDDELFNDEWMESLKEENRDYSHFFYTNTNNIIVNYIYINRQNEITSIFNKSLELKNNILSKEDLFTLIRSARAYNHKKYRLLSLLSYNFDLNNDEIEHFHKNNKTYEILKVHKNLNAIYWNKSINFFKDLNEIYMVFVEKKNQKSNKTRHIFIKQKLKKTKRKRLK